MIKSTSNGDLNVDPLTSTASTAGEAVSLRERLLDGLERVAAKHTAGLVGMETTMAKLRAMGLVERRETICPGDAWNPSWVSVRHHLTDAGRDYLIGTGFLPEGWQPLSKAERYMPLSLFTNLPAQVRVPEPAKPQPIALKGGCLLYRLKAKATACDLSAP